jgi:hypothetical protein
MHQAGWQQFADDALVLRLDRDRVTACPLPFTPGLTPASRAHFADGVGPSSHSPQLQPTELPLIAVFLLQQNPRLTSHRLSLLPQARAFSELLAHAHCFDADDPTQMRRLVLNYLEVVTIVPVFTLEYRPDFQHLPQLTRAVVGAAGSIDAGRHY